jgi:hypothetical protein
MSACMRVELPGGAVAWYPLVEGQPDEAGLLCWSAPADGATALMMEGLQGEPRRYEGLSQVEAEVIAAERLTSAGWTVVPG